MRKTSDAMENMAWRVNGTILKSVDLDFGVVTGVGMSATPGDRVVAGVPVVGRNGG